MSLGGDGNESGRKAKSRLSPFIAEKPALARDLSPRRLSNSTERSLASRCGDVLHLRGRQRRCVPTRQRRRVDVDINAFAILFYGRPGAPASAGARVLAHWPNADRLGLDLYQLHQRGPQATGVRHGAREDTSLGNSFACTAGSGLNTPKYAAATMMWSASCPDAVIGSLAASPSMSRQRCRADGDRLDLVLGTGAAGTAVCGPTSSLAHMTALGWRCPATCRWRPTACQYRPGRAKGWRPGAGRA